MFEFLMGIAFGWLFLAALFLFICFFESRREQECSHVEEKKRPEFKIIKGGKGR
jgi:hypothetical protein